MWLFWVRGGAGEGNTGFGAQPYGLQGPSTGPCPEFHAVSCPTTDGPVAGGLPGLRAQVEGPLAVQTGRAVVPFPALAPLERPVGCHPVYGWGIIPRRGLCPSRT